MYFPCPCPRWYHNVFWIQTINLNCGSFGPIIFYLFGNFTLHKYETTRTMGKNNNRFCFAFNEEYNATVLEDFAGAWFEQYPCRPIWELNYGIIFVIPWLLYSMPALLEKLNIVRSGRGNNCRYSIFVTSLIDEVLQNVNKIMWMNQINMYCMLLPGTMIFV